MLLNRFWEKWGEDMHADYDTQTLKSMRVDSILKEAEGRIRKDGKESTGLKTRYSAKELLER